MFCVGCDRGEPACTKMRETACGRGGSAWIKRKPGSKTTQKQFTCIMKKLKKTIS